MVTLARVGSFFFLIDNVKLNRASFPIHKGEDILNCLHLQLVVKMPNIRYNSAHLALHKFNTCFRHFLHLTQ